MADPFASPQSKPSHPFAESTKKAADPFAAPAKKAADPFASFGLSGDSPPASIDPFGVGSAAQGDDDGRAQGRSHHKRRKRGMREPEQEPNTDSDGSTLLHWDIPFVWYDEEVSTLKHHMHSHLQLE
jgi:hypothetical protein